MKSKTVLVAGALGSIVLCGAAQARGITVNAWQVVSTGTGPTVFLTPMPAFNSLSFTPGTPSPNNYIVGAGPGTEYAWGGDANTTTPSEQVILHTISSDSLGLDFGYSGTFGGAGETAKVVVATADGTTTTFTANDPASFSSESAYDLVLTATKGVLSYVEGIGDTWSVSSTSEGGGTAAAPEIDPASAGSALTLLGAALAILRGRARRRSKAGAEA